MKKEFTEIIDFVRTPMEIFNEIVEDVRVRSLKEGMSDNKALRKGIVVAVKTTWVAYNLQKPIAKFIFGEMRKNKLPYWNIDIELHESSKHIYGMAVKGSISTDNKVTGYGELPSYAIKNIHQNSDGSNVVEGV